MAGFSTATTFKNRVKGARFYKTFYENDTLRMESDVFDQANDKVASIIRGALKKTYGTTEIATWTGSSIPALIQDISDDLLIYELRSTNPAEWEQFRMLRDDAYDLLRRLGDGEDPLTLYDVDIALTDDMYTYDTPESVFEDFED